MKAEKAKYHIITYDFGTSSVKAVLMDDMFQLLDVCYVYYPTVAEHPGWATQKVEDYWASFKEATRTLLDRAKVDAKSVRGIAMSQTTADVIFVDENGDPLDDCIIWIDGRAEKQAEEINQRLGENIYQGKNVPPKVLWYQQNRPEVFKKAKYLLDVSAYLYWKLTGVYAYDLSGAFGSQMLDDETLEWSDKKLKASNISRDLLPQRIVDSIEAVGSIHAEAAKETGLCEGTKVFGGCSDNANGQIGTGCIRSGDIHIYIGSSSWFEVTTTKQEKNKGNYPSAIRDMRYHFRCTDTACSGIDAITRLLYPAELREDPDGIHEFLNQELLEAERNPQNVIFLPFLFGEQDPVQDTEVRGSMLNVTPSTQRKDILHAFVEGIAFNLRWMKEQHMDMTGTWTEKAIRTYGGGAQSDVILQIVADVLGDTLIRLQNPRTSGNIGLGVCVAVGLGEASGFEVLDDIVKEEKEFRPRKAQSEIYDARYQIYRNAYTALKNTYHALNGAQ